MLQEVPTDLLVVRLCSKAIRNLRKDSLSAQARQYSTLLRYRLKWVLTGKNELMREMHRLHMLLRLFNYVSGYIRGKTYEQVGVVKYPANNTYKGVDVVNMAHLVYAYTGIAITRGDIMDWIDGAPRAHFPRLANLRYGDSYGIGQPTSEPTP